MFTDETGCAVITTTIIKIIVTEILIGTAIAAIDGAICAGIVGDNVWIGLGAGALSGFVGSIVGVVDPVIGRGVGSLLFNICYQSWHGRDLDNEFWIACYDDVKEDILLSFVYTKLYRGIPRPYRSIAVGFTDATVDITQTIVSQSQANALSDKYAQNVMGIFVQPKDHINGFSVQRLYIVR